MLLFSAFVGEGSFLLINLNIFFNFAFFLLHFVLNLLVEFDILQFVFHLLLECLQLLFLLLIDELRVLQGLLRVQFDEFFKGKLAKFHIRMSCVMIVVMMLVIVIASWAMLVAMFLLMMMLVMMSVIVLAPWTVLVVCFFVSLAISFMIVIAVLSMLMSMVRVVLVSTTEIESWLQLTQSEESSSRCNDSLGGQNSEESDGGSQH